MTVTRLPRNKENPFVVLPVSAVRNSELSGTEFRVLSILLSLPEGWQPIAKHLATQMREGTYAISKAIQNLKAMGYLVCRSIRDSLGRFVRTEWDIHEIPQKPEGENLDVRGNVIEIDRAKPKKPRRTTKEGGEKAKPQTLIVKTSDPYLENPNMGNRDRSNIDIQNTDLDLERDSAASEESEGEKQAIAEKSASESFASRQIFAGRNDCERSGRSDRHSATAQFDEIELREFNSQLIDLGKKMGRYSPPGWAFRVIENLTEGKPSIYWEEFKAGIPIGTSEQREWEIAPGVPCSIVKQCLEDHYLSKPGATKQEAALQAGRSLAKPKLMESLWQSIKERVIFLKREADRLSELGVQNSTTVDPWMRPKPEISVGDFSEAIATLQGSAREEFPPLQIQDSRDPYAPTPASQEAREKAKASLRKRFGKPTKSEKILAANIAEIEKFPAVESVQVPIAQRAR